MFFDEDSLVTWHFWPTLCGAFMMSESHRSDDGKPRVHVTGTPTD
jgi:hypothetical protein